MNHKTYLVRVVETLVWHIKVDASNSTEAEVFAQDAVWESEHLADLPAPRHEVRHSFTCNKEMAQLFEHTVESDGVFE